MNDEDPSKERAQCADEGEGDSTLGSAKNLGRMYGAKFSPLSKTGLFVFY